MHCLKERMLWSLASKYFNLLLRLALRSVMALTCPPVTILYCHYPIVVAFFFPLSLLPGSTNKKATEVSVEGGFFYETLSF